VKRAADNAVRCWTSRRLQRFSSAMTQLLPAWRCRALSGAVWRSNRTGTFHTHTHAYTHTHSHHTHPRTTHNSQVLEGVCPCVECVCVERELVRSIPPLSTTADAMPVVESSLQASSLKDLLPIFALPRPRLSVGGVHRPIRLFGHFFLLCLVLVLA
jgi:hypothetical protein